MSDRTQRLTRRQQKLSEKGTYRDNIVRIPTLQHLHMELKEFGPITDNQASTFQAYGEGNHLSLIGCAGTGKTFISMYLALKEIYFGKSKRKKLIIVRSAQSSKDIGFLPGTEKQKTEVYENVYKAICSELFGRDDAYEVLKNKNVIEFHSTSFLRGTTIDNAIIIIDECQNLKQQEWFTVLTRVGNHSRVVVCGDTKQDDLTSERYKEVSGIHDLIRVMQEIPEVSFIKFGIDDIVRSGFVRSVIIASYKLNI